MNTANITLQASPTPHTPWHWCCATHQLFNRARQLHDELTRAQQTAAFNSIEFIQCVAASREIAQRLSVVPSM